MEPRKKVHRYSELRPLIRALLRSQHPGCEASELFERYKRSEKTLVATLAEMYLQGVGTRKVKVITEELCAHQFSASAISDINKRLDEELHPFVDRRLEEEFPYLILDTRYEKVREEGVIYARAVLVALGIDWDGRRQVLAVELATRESATSWKEFLLKLKSRGLRGVAVAITDDHAELKRSLAEVLPEALWQRCYAHFLSNAANYLPRKVNDDCLTELRSFYVRSNLEGARGDLVAWLGKWQAKYPKLCEWVEGHIEETFTFYRLPKEHHKHLKSTNMLKRLNGELQHRTHVIRIFPNPESCLRLIRAVAIEINEGWLETHCYLDMGPLAEEQKKSQLLGWLTCWDLPS